MYGYPHRQEHQFLLGPSQNRSVRSSKSRRQGSRQRRVPELMSRRVLLNRGSLAPLLVLLIGCGSATIASRDGGGTGGNEATGGTAPGTGGGAAGVSGGTGGNSGAAGSGPGGASGGAAGGLGGATGGAGVAGATGGAGVAGTGGGAGAAGTDGGAAGAGGATGGSGAAGTGGSAGTAGSLTPGYVVCGSVSNCPVTSGGQCCYSNMDQSSTCQAAGATCDPVPATTAGTYYIKTTIACDSASDCPSGQICCYTSVYIGSSTACMAASACVDAPPPGMGGYSTSRRQLCDPTKVVPSECLSGTCKTATTFSQDLPSYLYLCL